MESEVILEHREIVSLTHSLSTWCISSSKKIKLVCQDLIFTYH
ncbi:unnamed protein product [Gulo gulo]|uniref:Uncharacterized protein n=1 Tax=Gulo gulo TaxID=48420 RepID=A0A9X9QB74_GULGU|nr:unnamed protein product [Gulo gulo]